MFASEELNKSILNSSRLKHNPSEKPNINQKNMKEIIIHSINFQFGARTHTNT